MNSKSEHRKRLLRKMAALSQPEVEKASRRAAKKALLVLDWTKIGRILSYKPIPGANEINPSFLVDALPGKTIHVVGNVRDETLPSESYDVILVPLVGFDEQKYRLGRGGGWYDRLLAEQPTTVSIGLGYDFTKISELPHEDHDIALDIIITSALDHK